MVRDDKTREMARRAREAAILAATEEATKNVRVDLTVLGRALLPVALSFAERRGRGVEIELLWRGGGGNSCVSTLTFASGGRPKK